MTKKCTKCGEEKPLSEFYAGGRKSQCKGCHRIGVERWRSANRERHNARCNERGKERRRENPLREREIHRRNVNAYAARQRAARAQRAADWAAAHPDLAALIASELADDRRRREASARERAAARIRSPEHRAAVKAWHEAHREQRAAYIAAWKQANPDKCRSHDRKRRAAIAACPPDEARRVADFYEFVRTASHLACAYCGTSVPQGDRHVDHVVPLSKGGAHAVANLACACGPCNLAKHAKTPEQMGLVPA